MDYLGVAVYGKRNLYRNAGYGDDDYITVPNDKWNDYYWFCCRFSWKSYVDYICTPKDCQIFNASQCGLRYDLPEGDFNLESS